MTDDANQRSATPAYLDRRRRALEKLPGPEGVDQLDPKSPAGHADAIRIESDDLRRLAGLVWEGGAEEIDRFIQIALRDEPFPI